MNTLKSIFGGKPSNDQVSYTALNDANIPSDTLNSSVNQTTQAAGNVLRSQAQPMHTRQPRNSLRSFAALSIGTNGNIDDGTSTVGKAATVATWDGKTVGSADPTETAETAFPDRSLYEPSFNEPDSPPAPVDNGSDSLVFVVNADQ